MSSASSASSAVKKSVHASTSGAVKKSVHASTSTIGCPSGTCFIETELMQ